MPIALHDVVRLKSGGPDMTVEGLRKNSAGEELAFCKWFEGSKLRGEAFLVAILTKDPAPIAAPAPILQYKD